MLWELRFLLYKSTLKDGEVMALKPVSVSQLNGYIKRILQSDPILGNVSVAGEISNLKFHSTGHVYFSLKDEASKVNCFLAAENKSRLRFEPADGMQVILHGFIYLYERGGTYSVNVREIEADGIGNLSIAFEKLKTKLQSEGLFDEKYKRPLPFFPSKVAVVTSATGAAVMDIQKTVRCRNNIADIMIFPVLVQGPGAAGEISAAIEYINRKFPDVDVIITGRGGGSMEELWAFNEEIVARSIFASKIPVISAVGHETDFTIADFVADKRAATPTAAAQMAVPDVFELKETIDTLKNQLCDGLGNCLARKELMLRACSPDIMHHMLKARAEKEQMKVEALRSEITESVKRKIKDCETKLNSLMSNLEVLDPMNVLKRGYTAVTDEKGNFRTSAAAFSEGERLDVIFSDGKLKAKAEEIVPGTDMRENA
ncbi:MAG: exodeoxyribonuclease VII large subunit [Clostridia bacterium]|nr:exodeoxyribonuclease VII large subunit [Clostridia bacterium]